MSFRSLLCSAALLLAAGVAHAQPAERIFDEKSGVLEMKASIMGMSPTVTMYFDDYGAKTATVVRVKFEGQQSVQHSIVIGDTTLKWNEETMEGRRTVNEGEQRMPLTAYLNLDPARKRALNYRQIGTKRILGKTATGFSLDSGGVSVKVWHWHKIPLLMEVKRQEGTMTFKVVRLAAPSAVPSSAFEVPAGVTFRSPTEEPSPTE